jgi:hypothetical protein
MLTIDTLPAPTARARFDAGFAAGYRHATSDDVQDVAGHPDPFYACGYSRGVIWSAADWQPEPAEAWPSFLSWCHEAAPRLAAELVTVEDLDHAEI